AVCWEDDCGQIHHLDPAAIYSNGSLSADGEFIFETLDPMLFLPIAGPVRQLTVRGCCRADDLLTSVASLERSLQVARTPPPAFSTLYLDAGEGFREELTCQQPPPDGDFEL